MAALLLLGAWTAWLTAGRVSIYAVSQQARLEADHYPMPVEAPVDGVVAACDLALSKRVQPGDVLVHLDTQPFERRRDELVAQLTADSAAVDGLAARHGAEERARDAIRDLSQKTAQAGSAKVSAQETSARSKSDEADVLQRLQDASLATGLDVMRARSDARSQRAQTSATSAQAALDTSGSVATVRDRDAQLASLDKELSDARTLAEVHRAQLSTAQYEIERRVVRATVRGVLADIVACTSGMAVVPGQRLAVVLPDAELRVVGYFNPEDSIGRVRPGQPAVLRIDNFPWTQYGTLAAVVDHVGAEPRDGVVRVELRLGAPNASIPSVHGLTGKAEVEVERVAPLQLLLRMAGQYVTGAAKPLAAPAPHAGS